MLADVRRVVIAKGCKAEVGKFDDPAVVNETRAAPQVTVGLDHRSMYITQTLQDIQENKTWLVLIIYINNISKQN